MLILPVEIINNNWYWRQLGDFLAADLEVSGAIPKINSTPREGLHQNVYPLKKIRDGTLLTGIRQIMNLPEQNQRNLSKSFLRNTRFNARNFGRIVAGSRETTFIVTDLIRDRLKDCYQDENWALAEQIGFDLKSLGY